MKKVFLLLMSITVLTGCEIEDDGPDSVQVLAEVIDTNLPESFEPGEVYQVEITYLLPNVCHIPVGVQAVRGGAEGSARRDIYVSGVASYLPGEGECTLENEDLEEIDSFSLRVDEDEPYTFYLWTGFDENQESIYTQIVVPVGETTPTTSVK
ncbi:hypothetical protein [Salinimicrobium terrae]|uniref:hypothetical protein n=1 Tax=Salinimicrobium terrae TaxID=470866 RepID=UPI00041D7F2A|nr:hypothetical protein [Salinimicrobium terrae]